MKDSLPKNKALHIPISKIWFDKILSGEKKIEYREVKDHWNSRILKKSLPPIPLTNLPKYYFKEFDCAILKNGYQSQAPLIAIEITKINIIDGANTDLKLKNKLVFAIHLGEILYTENTN